MAQLTHDELLKYVNDLQDNSIQEKPPKNCRERSEEMPLGINNSSVSPSSEIAPPQKRNSKMHIY